MYNFALAILLYYQNESCPQEGEACQQRDEGTW